MKRRAFRDGDRDITEIGLGTWQLGGREAGRGSYGPIDERTAIDVVRSYIEGGGSFIDTARNYAASEELIGKALREGAYAREGLFIASKSGKTESTEEIPLIREECETSLRNLGVDYLDLYQIHAPPEEPELMERVLDEFSALKEEGKVHRIGASVKGSRVGAHTVELARRYVESGRIDALQLIYSIFRQRNQAVFDLAREHRVGVIARTALESGFLTGKYAPGMSFPEDHRKRWSREKIDALCSAAAEIAEHTVGEPYESLAEVALAFVLSDARVSCVIPGARTPEHVKANLRVDKLPLLPGEALEFLRKFDMEETANP